MSQSDFEKQLQKSQQLAEIPVANWFRHHGRYVLPAYILSEATAQAPVLETEGGRIVVPDLQVFDGYGPPYWVEVKWKKGTSPDGGINTRKLGVVGTGGTERTGFETRLFEHYKQLGEIAHADVFFMFAQADADVVTCDSLKSLNWPGCKFLIYGKDNDGNPNKDQHLWALDKLTPVGSLKAFQSGDFPPLPEALRSKARKMALELSRQPR